MRRNRTPAKKTLLDYWGVRPQRQTQSYTGDLIGLNSDTDQDDDNDEYEPTATLNSGSNANASIRIPSKRRSSSHVSAATGSGAQTKPSPKGVFTLRSAQRKTARKTPTRASPSNHARSAKRPQEEASFYLELVSYIQGPSGAIVVEREVFEDRDVAPIPKAPPHPPAQLAIRSRAPKRRRIMSDEKMAAPSQHIMPANASEAGSILIRHNGENVTQEPTEPAQSPKSLRGKNYAPKWAQKPIVNTSLPADQPSLFSFGTDAPKCQHPVGPNGGGWPTSSDPNQEHPRALPVEVFEMIGSLLPRDSVQNMRLVNREFEKKISCYVFQSVVVPFKPKIYGTAGTPRRGSGVGELIEVDLSKQHAGTKGPAFGGIYDPKESHVKDGMRVFQEWGPEIKKFALTFEVAEESLIGLRSKEKGSITTSFWGSYEWPYMEYNRYEQAAKFEQKADETSRMTIAFSKLKGMRELGLSVLSGQGWLAGPDLSDRAKLLETKPIVFGTKYSFPDEEVRERLEKWNKIVAEETQKTKKMPYAERSDQCFFEIIKKTPQYTSVPVLEIGSKAPARDRVRPPIMFDGVNVEAQEECALDNDLHIRSISSSPSGRQTTLLSASTSTVSSPARDAIVPNKLSPEQEEWLMEMEWAQTAFLNSWCIAVIDNPTTFRFLRTFNIANISSNYLTWLHRLDLWNSLLSLSNLTVLVSPDWRRLSKDEQGNVFSRKILASSAQAELWDFLFVVFGKDNKNKKNIKTLRLGYLDGGEHAVGMFARNKNVLPAPIMKFTTISSETGPRPIAQGVIYLSQVTHLTLTNCWLTPAATKTFFSKHKKAKLESVTFDSVSLVADRDHNFSGTLASPPQIEDTASRAIKWLSTNPVKGSWADVINAITPGTGIAHA
ncbi:MAG: hypothetical protein Q9181_006593, partial [Wetmoreana brouardii]